MSLSLCLRGCLASSDLAFLLKLVPGKRRMYGKDVFGSCWVPLGRSSMWGHVGQIIGDIRQCTVAVALSSCVKGIVSFFSDE